MPASASGCALTSATSATAMQVSLKTIRVLADPRNDQASAVDAFQNGNDVHGENADPGKHEQQAEHAAETERCKTDEAREDHVGEDRGELGHHQHESVLRVPLHLGIVFFE